MYSFLFFLSLQNQRQHFHFSSLSIGIQTSLNTTEGDQFVSKTQRTSDYHHCFSSHSMQKAWQFERTLSSRVHKGRAMFSKLDARISRRLFSMQKPLHELNTFTSLPLSQLYSIVCNVCSTLGSFCAAKCKMTMKQRIHSRHQVIIHMCIYFHPPREYLCYTFHMGVVRWWTRSPIISAVLCALGQVRHPSFEHLLSLLPLP